MFYIHKQNFPTNIFNPETGFFSIGFSGFLTNQARSNISKFWDFQEKSLKDQRLPFETPLFLPRHNLFFCLVDHQEYTEYTDAYGRPEIEMMKNSVGNNDLLSQEENKENQLSNEHNKKQKQPNNWYLLYLSGMSLI